MINFFVKYFHSPKEPLTEIGLRNATSAKTVKNLIPLAEDYPEEFYNEQIHQNNSRFLKDEKCFFKRKVPTILFALSASPGERVCGALYGIKKFVASANR